VSTTTTFKTNKTSMVMN